MSRQLQVPTYDVFLIFDFVRKKLYLEHSPAARKTLFDAFVKANGPAFRDGISLQLFSDLDNQIAAEEGRLHPPPQEKLDARAAIVQCTGTAKA